MKLNFSVTVALAAATCLAATAAGAQRRATYVAMLHPMNVTVTHSQASGQARFSISGDRLAIDITIKGVPPNMVHWQHFHGFADNRDATCPTAAADVNHDGIVDLIETEPSSGTTMVPFDTHPAAMDIARGIYPRASAAGTYHYRATVSLSGLQAAFAKAFPGQKLDLDRRVVFVHGVPAGSKLPASVASLDSIPAQVTLPIACGKIGRAAR